MVLEMILHKTKQFTSWFSLKVSFETLTWSPLKCCKSVRRSLERVQEQLFESRGVRAAITGSGCCHHWSSGIAWLGLSAQMCLNISESWLDVTPSTSILWLFLSPSDGSIGIVFQLSHDLSEWEWTETLNSENSNIISIVFCSSCFKIIVDLSGTENDFFNLVSFKSTCVFVSDNR